MFIDRYLKKSFFFAPEDGGGASPAPAASSDGGGSPSPSPSSQAGESGTSSNTPPVGTTTTKESVDNELFDFGVDSDGNPLEAEELEPIVTDVQPATTPQEAAPPPASPQATTPQQPAPQTPQEPSPEASEPRPSFTPADPISMARAMAANEAAFVEHLAQTEFALTQEDIQGLEEDAVSYTPKLLARTYMKMQLNLMGHLARVVPAMIQAHNQTTSQNSERETSFYAKWPDLNKKEYKDTVQRYARAYRSANPQASFEQMTEELGPMLMALLKINPSAPAAPASGAQPRSRTTATHPPFRPAMSGPSSPPPPQVDDPWAGLDPAQDYDG